MRCIREILNQFGEHNNLDISWDEFDVRLKNEVPDLSYDIYISTGGPFDLKYVNNEGKDETPLCIHRAPLGTHERMIGFLIEHYAGNFPVWLSPEQVRVIPISDSHNEYASQLLSQLQDAGIRAEADLESDRMNAKIRKAQLMKVPYMLVVGDKEMEQGVVSLRKRNGSQQNNLPVAEFVAMASERIAGRSAEL